MARRISALAVGVLGIVVATGGSAAAATPGGACAAKKVTLAGRKASALASCYSRAALRGMPVDPACVQRASDRFDKAMEMLETDPDCITTGDKDQMGATVDMCAAELGCLPTGCCPAQEWVGSGFGTGTVRVGGMEVDFPVGVVATLQVGESSDVTCAHDVIVPANGFSVPTFCIAELNYSSRLLAAGCADGEAAGRGKMWDTAACCPDTDVSKVGDTSDGVCDAQGKSCAPAGAGGNTLGDIDATRGDGECDERGVNTTLDIPVTSLTWTTPDGKCPDPDGAYTPGRDKLITEFDFVLTATSGTATAEFVDKNEDGCALAGAGPVGPLSVSGEPAPGPCCEIGQTITMAAAGPAFPGAAPAHDLLYELTLPIRITDCRPLGSLESCTLSDGGCAD